jgi:hypothetical protein
MYLLLYKAIKLNKFDLGIVIVLMSACLNNEKFYIKLD